MSPAGSPRSRLRWAPRALHLEASKNEAETTKFYWACGRESWEKLGCGDPGREKQTRDPLQSQREGECMCTKTRERNSVPAFLVPKSSWGLLPFQSLGLMKSASILPIDSFLATKVPCITCWAPLQPQVLNPRTGAKRTNSSVPTLSPPSGSGIWQAVALKWVFWGPVTCSPLSHKHSNKWYGVESMGTIY